MDYRNTQEIDAAELRNALWSLHLLGDDIFMRMQALNLSIVDPFLMNLEADVLKQLNRSLATNTTCDKRDFNSAVRLLTRPGMLLT